MNSYNPRKCTFILLAILSLAFWPSPSISEDQPGTRSSDFVLLPFAYYTPETTAALVITGIYTSPGANPDTRPTNIMAFLTYTMENQRMVEFFPEIYTASGFRIISGLGAMDFPDKFYGIGSDTQKDDEENYTRRSFSLDASVQYQLLPAFYAGIKLDYENMKIEDTETGGLLDTGPYQGSDGGVISGSGLIVTWDSRDDIFWTTAGSFAEAEALYYKSSDFDYDTFTLDLRQYVTPGSITFAFQEYLHLSGGDPPFFRLARLGGSSRMRGYFRGRFRDRSMAILQAESRLWISSRFAVVAFGSTGSVAPSPVELTENTLTALGAGIRYRLGKEEAINLRIDLAWGEEDNSGVYFMIKEAF
jgi:hypothetical protein